MASAEQGIRTSLVPLWRMIRHLYPVYARIAEYCELAPPPDGALSRMEHGDDDILLELGAWVDQIDAATQPQQLRTVWQELGIACSDLSLQMWLQHFLFKPCKTSLDRDKVDFLLVQYLCLNLPPSMQDGRVNRAAIAAVLEPVIGAGCDELPAAASDVNELIGITERCRSLADIERSGTISRGRELKLRAGEMYFTPAFLLTFTHFNTVVRRECQRLMNSDLKFIGEAIDRLEKQGITHIDCRAANWSDSEPLADLKNKWATWELDNRDYSSNFFASLIGFRAAMEEALSRSSELSMSFVSQELRTIHELLKEMRLELNELPRKLAMVAIRPPGAARGEIHVVGKTIPRPSGIRPVQITNAMSNAETVVNAIAPVAAEFPVAAEIKAAAAIPQSEEIPAHELEAALKSPTAAPVSIPTPQQGEKTIAGIERAAAGSTALPDPPTTPAIAPCIAKDAPVVSAPDLNEGIARLQKTLSGKRPTAVSIAVAATRVLLTGGEVAMFSEKETVAACAVQRAVMSRIFLVSALEGYGKDRDKARLLPVAGMARAEQESLRAVIATCKANQQLREEEVLTVSNKQLSAMVERAERILR
jgi:hypothetical protein